MGFLRCGKRVSYKTGLCRYDSFGPKRVGFGCFPTRFAQVAAAFAVSWACGRCACVRGAWEEGRGGDGVGAMGSCQGVFGVWDWSRRGRCAAPLPWVPAFARTTVGGAGPPAGTVSGYRTPPLWIPAFAGMTLGVVRERRLGCAGRAGAVGGGGPFDRLRANGISKRVCDVGWWGRVAARRTSGYRLSPVRRWRVWEVREAEAAPRRAPALGSRFRREDGGGSGPLAGFVSGYRTPPLWIPAFAGMTETETAPASPPLQSTNGHVLLVGVP